MNCICPSPRSATPYANRDVLPDRPRPGRQVSRRLLVEGGPEVVGDDDSRAAGLRARPLRPDLPGRPGRPVRHMPAQDPQVSTAAAAARCANGAWRRPWRSGARACGTSTRAPDEHLQRSVRMPRKPGPSPRRLGGLRPGPPATGTDAALSRPGAWSSTVMPRRPARRRTNRASNSSPSRRKKPQPTARAWHCSARAVSARTGTPAGCVVTGGSLPCRPGPQPAPVPGRLVKRCHQWRRLGCTVRPSRRPISR